MGRGRRRGQGEERLLRTIQTAGRQVSSIAHHHHQASALTFIQVWKVRSLTSRSFCRAPASSAQCGMGVGPSECCRGGGATQCNSVCCHGGERVHNSHAACSPAAV